MPAFSVIVPVYNVAPWLRDCLDSIRSQTFSDWECVCVDDGSTDGSGAILDEYSEKDPRFRVLHQPNAGAGAARNSALELVSGTFFLFVDGDDMIVPDSLACFSDAFGKTGDDAILCAPFNDLPDIPEMKTVRPGFEMLQSAMTPLSLLGSPYVPNGYSVSRVFRRSVFGCVRFPAGIKTAEDTRYQFDCLARQARWSVIRKKYYVYRRNRTGSASHALSPRFCREYLGALTYAVRTMRNRLDAPQTVLDNFLGQHAPTYVRGALRPAFRTWNTFSTDEKSAFFDELLSCRNACGSWPFRWTDRIRLLAWKCGLSRPFFPLLLLIDRLPDSLRWRWSRLRRFFHSFFTRR